MVVLLFYTGSAYSQIPADLEKDLDSFNAEIYKALSILNSQPEDIALTQISDIKQNLHAKAESLYERLERIPEITPEQEQAFMQKQMEKPLYKDMMTLLSDRDFIQKISNSSRLSNEFEELMAFLDLGEEEIEEDLSLSAASACTFTVSPEIPNSGEYIVSSINNEAIGFSDDTGDLTIEIYGRAKGNEISISLIADEPKPGRYIWSGEGQIYIQSYNEDGNEIILLQNYHEEGYIEIDKIEGVGGKISGRFKGLFFDDLEQTDQPIKVEGEFTVLHIEGAS